MARPRMFDPDAVLTDVMHVFRRKGFAACSVRDLEAATGLTSGSLYNAYHDKRGLFQAASEHYLSTVLRQRISTYAPQGTGIEGLRALFMSTLNEPGEGAFGCLITNSAVEFGQMETPDIVARGLDTLRAAFIERLEGDETGADALLAFYQGILVLVRAGQDKSALERMISRFFETFTQTMEKE